VFTSRTFTNVFLLGAFAIVLYLMFRILQPFLLPIFLAVVLFTLLEPFHQKLLARLNQRANLCALLICVGLTIVLVVPLGLLTIALARQAGDLYTFLRDPNTLTRLRAWTDPNTNPSIARFESWLPASVTTADIGAKLSEQAHTVGLAALAGITALAGGLLNFIVDYFIVFFGLFFLLRDSDYFADALRRVIPLSPHQETMFVQTFRDVTNASVVGTLVTAAVQGLLSGLMYLILGLPNTVLWGTLTGVASLVPVVGATAIWIPIALYLFFTGAPYSALVLVVFEAAVVGSVDNFLRPWLMEGRVQMHTLLIFFSILGGISYFGIFGVIIGPLVFAIGLTFFRLYLLGPDGAGEISKPDAA
jgi:predicted PurR-regulated permease PerM